MTRPSLPPSAPAEQLLLSSRLSLYSSTTSVCNGKKVWGEGTCDLQEAAEGRHVPSDGDDERMIRQKGLWGLLAPTGARFAEVC